MTPARHLRVCVFSSVVTVVALGCEKSGAPPQQREASEPGEVSKPAEPPKPAKTAQSVTPSGGSESTEAAAGKPASSPLAAETPLKLTGLTMTIPAGWIPQPVAPRPMAAKAVYHLPKAEGDDEDGTLRVTHFPGMKQMKNMEQANIERWLSQVKRPDGTPATRDDARISTVDVSGVRLTVVDVSGLVKTTTHAAPKPNSRMIAAILAHPNGPHFVIAAGGTRTMQRWEGMIDAFLKSAVAN